MITPLEDTFIKLLNQNLGIAHKVGRIYFPDAEDREDAVQEMMYQLWRSYPGFDGKAKFSTWMYSVCLHTALTYKRRSRNKGYEHLSSIHHQIPEAVSESSEASTRMLLGAIATLSQLNKAIVLLYLESMSYEEIASITGLTRSNVSVRLVRIKKELERKLSQAIKSIDDGNPG